MMNTPQSISKTRIYFNALSCPQDTEGFVAEGQSSISFESGRMRLSSMLDASAGQKANIVYWCPQIFPADVEISWDFYPIGEYGLCMMFFAAAGFNGENLFDPALAPRDGQYGCYNNGDFNTYHISYYRRNPSELSLLTCNLRKSSGFNLLTQGGDPIPNLRDCAPPYRIRITKQADQIAFYVNHILILQYQDDGMTYGPVLGQGQIGLRQMSPMVAEYANLEVCALG